LESDDLQAPPKADYVLSYRSILSEAQKERVIAFIQDIQPKVTVYVAVMQKRNVQPPGPFLVNSLLLLNWKLSSLNINLSIACAKITWESCYESYEHAWTNDLLFFCLMIEMILFSILFFLTAAHHVPSVIRVFPRNIHFHISHIEAQMSHFRRLARATSGILNSTKEMPVERTCLWGSG
jgi:hypothetical protein